MYQKSAAADVTANMPRVPILKTHLTSMLVILTDCQLALQNTETIHANGNRYNTKIRVSKMTLD